MSYTSFKQAILLLAASEVLLSDQGEVKEHLSSLCDAESAAESQTSAVYAVND